MSQVVICEARQSMYEWDENKRKTNLTNHGVDFAHMDAFEWESAVVDIDEGHAEPRWIGTGFIGAVLHVVVFTDRDDDIRIISLRKATRREARNYDKREK